MKKYLYSLIVMLTPILGISQSWMQSGQSLYGSSDTYFGYSVDISDDGTVIATGESWNSVRVFQIDGESWQQIGNDIDGLEGGENTGTYVVSLNADGSIVAIGNDAFEELTGFIRVYQFDGSDWNQLGSDIVGENQGDKLGNNISLNADGTFLATGEDGFDSNGRTRVFHYNGNEWVQYGSSLYGVNEGDDFGNAVSLNANGSLLAVGAHGASSASGTISVFEFVDGNWEQVGGSIIGEEGSELGWSVELSNSGFEVVGGAMATGGAAGQVKVFELIDGEWSQKGNDVEGSMFSLTGYDVDISGSGEIIAVGAPGFPGFGNTVKTYYYENEMWIQFGDDITGNEPGDQFGGALSLTNDGLQLVVGATNNDDVAENAGQVTTFNFACNLSSPTFDTPDDICEGDSTTVVTSVVEGVTEWYTDEVEGTPFHVGNTLDTGELTETTSFWIQASESVCASNREEVVVSVIPNPEAPTGDSEQYFFEGANLETLEIDAVGDVTWYSDAELTEEIEATTELSEGVTYYVTQTVDGCEGAALAITVFIDTSSIRDNVIEGFSYYPNPVSSVLNLKSEKESIVSIHISDVSGKLVKIVEAKNANAIEIPFNEMKNGIYLLKVTTIYNSAVYRVVKN